MIRARVGRRSPASCPTLLPPLLAGAACTREQGARRCARSWSRRRRSTAALAREFEEQTGIPLIQGWGLSEYTNFACCLSPDDAPDDEHRQLLFGGEVPVDRQPARRHRGRRCVDADGDDAAGEARAASSACAARARCCGYFRDEEATARALDPRRLAAHRRRGLLPPARAASAGLLHHRPDQGDHHPRRREVQPARARAAACSRRCPSWRARLVVARLPAPVHGEEIGAYLEAAALADDAARAADRAPSSGMPLDQRPKVILLRRRRPSRARTPARSSAASCSRCSPATPEPRRAPDRARVASERSVDSSVASDVGRPRLISARAPCR